MKVNELIKLLQESVEENPEVGEYDVNIYFDEVGYSKLNTIHIDSAFKYLELESE